MPILIGLLVVGGRRLRHLAFLQDDPLMQRFSPVRMLATARAASRWLQGFAITTVERLQGMTIGSISAGPVQVHGRPVQTRAHSGSGG